MKGFLLKKINVLKKKAKLGNHIYIHIHIYNTEIDKLT